MSPARRNGSKRSLDSESRRLEEKLRGLTNAAEQWMSLLREMERNGESGGGEYERYFQAYIEAKQQEKRVDLELFNVRHGLVD